MKITHTMLNTHELHENELLSALLTTMDDRIARQLTIVNLPTGALLQPLKHADAYAYFPSTALISVLSVIENGKSTEIGIIGCDGMIGLEGLTGGRNPYVQAKVQCAGTAYRLPVRLLRQEFNCRDDVRSLILRYMHSVISQIGQAVICSRVHSIEQRLCMKLLMSSDRLGSDELALTQSAISDLLGVRREGVTAAAGELRRLGVIDYHRGHIRILLREGLEERSCECYSVIQSQCHHLRPASTVKPRSIQPRGCTSTWQGEVPLQVDSLSLT